MAFQDRWAFERGMLWSADLTKLNGSPVEAEIPAELSQLGVDMLPRLLAAVEQMDPIAPEALARRFDLGCRCFAAQVDGTIAAYGWVTCGPEFVGEFERRLQVRKGEAYIWDCATLPGYRRQRLFSALLAHIILRLHSEGWQRLWIIGLNAALEINSGVAEVGLEPILRLTYLRLFERRVMMLSPVQSATLRQLASARRLLKLEGEHDIGPLLVGNSTHPKPPDTHYAG
jgi:GNAT superfamily N-acetyltransferase